MRNFLNRQSATALVATSLLASTAFAEPPTDAFIAETAERAMQTFNTPGMAIGIVRGGELVYAAGHGVKSIESGEPVDPDTIFQIASLTKAFTTAALGILVDEGKLGWDDRVIDYLPEFRMYDPWVTREFTIRDLLTHRSGLGLGAGDLLFWPDQESTRQEILQAMRHLKPATSFRTAYAYDNLLYVIAGEVVDAVSGMPWEDFVETRIMAPLGMDDCRALPSRVTDSGNRATPHMEVDGELRTTFFSGGGPTAAAGAVNCNLTGLARWAAMHLAGGEMPDGRRLLSAATHAELWKPVTLMPVSDLWREHARTHFRAYGLGWGLQDFLGHLYVSHSGGLQGMTTYIALLPELDVAVIVLTNQFTPSFVTVANTILHAHISDTPADWVAIVGESVAKQGSDAEQAVEAAFAARNTESRPSLPLAAYAGTYRDDWYGDVSVEEALGTLVMRFSRSDLLTGPLEHFQYDTFVARWEDRSLLADAYVTFSLGADGTVESIRMKAVSPATDFSYDFHDLDLRRVED
jgi:CubicO group peptidase (beta-lactamase class C family)